jgi:hypothetical protein
MHEFLALVRALREAQENYRVTGLAEHGIAARILEQIVDEYLAKSGYPVQSLPF